MRNTASAPHSAHAARITAWAPGAQTTTSSTPAARAVSAPMTTVLGEGAGPRGTNIATRPTGTSRSRTAWPWGSSTSTSRPRSASATARTFAIAVSRPARTAGSSACSASESSPGSTRSGPSTRSKRSTYRRSAPSPSTRTASTISATSSATDSAPGASECTRAAAASGSPPSEKRSTGTQALHDVVDRLGLELVRDRVGDQPRRRDGDLLTDREPVLAQRRARRREVDDRLDEPGQRRQLDRPLDLDDLGLPPGALEEVGGGSRVLGRDTHDAEPAQRLRRRVGLLVDARQHQRAAAVAEVEQLEDRALGLLHQDVLAGDPDVGGARLDVGRDVGRAHRDDAGVGEQQLAVVRADLGRVDVEPVEAVERLAEQRAARDGDRQPVAVHSPACSSPESAACRRSTPSAKPTAGRSRPKRPSRSS